MSHRHYILDGHTPVEVDLMTWARWYETADRTVAKTELPDGWVATVFLGLDHGWSDRPPILFETMAFRNGGVEDVNRYATWDEAEAGHAAMVAKLKGQIPKTKTRIKTSPAKKRTG